MHWSQELLWWFCEEHLSLYIAICATCTPKYIDSSLKITDFYISHHYHQLMPSDVLISYCRFESNIGIINETIQYAITCRIYTSQLYISSPIVESKYQTKTQWSRYVYWKYVNFQILNIVQMIQCHLNKWYWIGSIYIKLLESHLPVVQQLSMLWYHQFRWLPKHILLN